MKTKISWYGLLGLCLFGLTCATWINVTRYALYTEISGLAVYQVAIPIKIDSGAERSVKQGVVREVTAYNVGDPEQTDESPCIGAAGVNLCELVENGIIVFATNAYPLHSKICIDKIGCGEVLDRMAKRFTNRVDVAMSLQEADRAVHFGRQKLLVKLQ
jgi:3D (Asp-Asp-Asp) domain-containing protein